MNTNQVITQFIEGTPAKNGFRISTDGTDLYSYDTLIAFKDGASVYVTTHKYSATTDKQIHELWYRLEKRDETVQRPVNVNVDNRGWSYSRTGRKGSVGYRPVDDMGGGHTATFQRAVVRN